MKLLEHLALALGADDPKLHFPVLEQNHGRDAHHIEAAGQLEIFVNIDLPDPELPGVIGCDFIEDRGDHLARATPFRPEVDEDGLDRPFDLLIERMFG
jgi:hypothetical protein